MYVYTRIYIIILYCHCSSRLAFIGRNYILQYLVTMVMLGKTHLLATVLMTFDLS